MAANALGTGGLFGPLASAARADSAPATVQVVPGTPVTTGGPTEALYLA